MAGDQPERRLAAILASDIVGYSRLMSEDESGTLASLKAHRNATDPLILSHGGRIVKSTGDGLLVEFPSVTEAVNAAIEIQRTMAERNAVLPEDRRMALRIGINLGDVIADEDDVFGDGVNVASRLETLSEPGGICVSGIVYQSVKNTVDARFLPAGRQQLKNIAEPVDVWRVDMRGANARALARAAETVETEHAAIAVLPFENLSGDHEQDYFADGLTEDIISALSHQRELRVLSRNSTFAYKGQSIDLRQAARELDARYVLNGSVRKSGQRIRVTAQLIDGSNGYQTWSERYDRELEDIFAVQDDITSSIVARVAPELIITEAGRARAKPADNLDAWDLYLRGLWYYYQGKSAEEYAKARELVRSAIELNSEDPLSHCLLGRILMRGLIGRWFRGSAYWNEAIEECELAARLDDRNAEAHANLASLFGYRGQHDQAIAEGRRAVELGPAIAYCHRSLGAALLQAGEHEEAVIHLLRSISLNPNSPDNYTSQSMLAYAHYFLGRYDAALAWANQSILSNPNFAQVYGIRTATLAQLDRNDEAKGALQDFNRVFPDRTISRLRPNYRWKNAADIDHFMEGLRKAGLPE
jgi:adenylate cyclase